MVNFADSSKASTDKAVARALIYRGVVARVARRLGIDRSFVGRVAKGTGSSRRVREELRREVERLERALRETVA